MSDNHNEVKTVKRGKTNGYNSAHLHAKRNRKRQEAEARQREHDTLTLHAKIEKARSRRGESKREIARPTKMVEASGATPPEISVFKANWKVTVKKATKKVAKKKAAK